MNEPSGYFDGALNQAVMNRPAGADVWQVPQGDDSGLVVQFYEDAVEDEAASLLAGRPVCKPREMVRIFIPGDKSTVVDEPVQDEHRGRFPRQYAQFKAEEEQVPEGTPLSEWPLLNVAQRKELKLNGFHTVEQVAQVSDQTISMAGPSGATLDKLKAHAKAYIERAAGGQVERKLQEENRELRSEVETLKAQVAELGKMAAALKQQQMQPQMPVVEQTVQPQGMEEQALVAPQFGGAVKSALDDIPELEPAVPEKKTPAERQREYRERKKAEKAAQEA